MSRDGGLTWSEIRKGSHVYEITDHGGLIILAGNEEAQTNILYSWNEGLTWTEMKVSDTGIEIDNIISEPSNE